MNVLNLDDLSKARRTITLGGKDYEVVDMTVENYIETTKKAKELGENPNEIEQMEAYIEMISRSIPGLEAKVLRGLSVEKLMMILRFLSGTLDEGAKAEEEQDSGKA